MRPRRRLSLTARLWYIAAGMAIVFLAAAALRL